MGANWFKLACMVVGAGIAVVGEVVIPAASVGTQKALIAAGVALLAWVAKSPFTEQAK